ncbi:Transmembrane protein 62, partial [Blyttiomyces sp. JEL0837]
VVDKAKNESHNHTIVATHYPTSATVIGLASDGRGIRELAPSVSMWVCGHLHQLVAGLGKRMYAYHQVTNLLELELGDMKDHAMYRIVAIDHDMISFTDETISSLRSVPMPVHHDITKSPPKFGTGVGAPPQPIKPIILITNPRDSRFATPTREPISRIKKSKFIRMMIWTFDGDTGGGVGEANAALGKTHVSVVIDGVHALGNVKYVGKTKSWKGISDVEKGNHLPLWVAPWNPAVFDDGKDHELTVIVSDSRGEKSVKRIVFRVDGERAAHEGMHAGFGGVVLKFPFNVVFKFLFCFVHLTITMVLLLPKLYSWHLHSTGQYRHYRSMLAMRLKKIRATHHHLPIPTTEPDDMEEGGDDDVDSSRGIRSHQLNKHHGRTLWDYLVSLPEQSAIHITMAFMNLVETPRLFYPLY